MLQSSMIWPSQPTHVRFFLVYLAVIVCTALAYSLMLTSRLYSLRSRITLSLRTLSGGTLSAELLAEYALANRVRLAPLDEGSHSPDVAKRASDELPALSTLRSAERKFQYLWEMCHANIETIRRLAFLTFLLSFLTVIYGAYPTFTAEFGSGSITGKLALYNSMNALLYRLALGLCVGVVLYALFTLFKGAIERRRIRWNYFCAILNERLSKG
jgi:hypothetical protein